MKPRGAASRASIKRYLRAFEGSGGDIRSLVPSTRRRDAGHGRLPAAVDDVIEEVFSSCRAAPAYRTVRDVYLMIVHRIAEANRVRPVSDQLRAPAETTVFRRIRAAAATALLRRKLSRTEAHATAAVRPGPQPACPLARVEIDHTPLDLILVDEDDRLPIGRPTVTLALDVYTGFPTGVHVGFEPAGYGAAMRCLLHSILPKEDTRAHYGTVHPWPVYGLPELLVVDNAPHLVGADLHDACAQLAIRLDPAPVCRPWFKGAIERQFRTHNSGLVHTLPGTTFSNVLQRGDHDSERHACISLARFWEILHIYLLDVYSQDWHDGVTAVPAQRWEDACAGGWSPTLHHDAREVRILLGRHSVRTIQRTGIDHLSRRYQSAELDALRQALPAGTPVHVKYDPENLGDVFVCDATQGTTWLQIPALDQGYAQGLSLWKHRVIRHYVRCTMHQAVDVVALAAAKARIQEIVEQEFRRSRLSRHRKTGARFLGAGAAGAPTLPGLAPAMPTASPDAASAPAPVPVDATWESTVPEPDAAAGWGADYNLPHQVSRDPWR